MSTQTNTPPRSTAPRTATPRAGGGGNGSGNGNQGNGVKTSGHETRPTPVEHLSVPSTLRNGDVVSVGEDNAGANTAVTIVGELDRVTVMSQTVIIYVPASGQSVRPHLVGLQGPAPALHMTCRKGMRGCVAQRVARRVALTTVFYRVRARARADRSGRVNARLTLRYAARRTQRLTLTVTVQTARGTTMTHRDVTVKPGHTPPSATSQRTTR